MTQRDGARLILVAASMVILSAGVRFAAPFVTLLLLAGALAIATQALVDALLARRVPRWLALGAGLLTALMALGSLALVLGVALRRLTERLPLYEAQFTRLLADLLARINARGLGLSMDHLGEVLDASHALALGTSLLQGTASAASRLLVVLVLVGFMLVEAPRLRDKLYAHGDSGTKTAHRVRTYLLVKTATSLVTGTLVFLLCRGVGVDLATLWGVLAYLLNYIPTFGSFIAAVPAVALALVQLGWAPALAVAVGYIAINTVIGIVLEPRWLGHVLGLSPLIVLLSLLFWGFLLGPVGALLSAPLTMFVRDWLLQTSDLKALGELMNE
jgi:AI-2 transport protein TqsA